MKRLLSLILIALCAGCPDPTEDKNPPVDHPYFPSAIIQKDDTLFVFASNFDQRYDYANAMTVDLKVVRASLDVNNPVLGSAAVTSSGFIPNFPDAPVLTPKNDAILYLSRGERSLRTIPLSTLGTQFACDSTKTLGQDCFSFAPALRFDQMNPYYLGTFATSSQDLSGGYVAYILDPGVLHADETGDFGFPQFFELDRFTWNTANATAQIDQRFGIANKLVPIGTPNTGYRRFNARIGGLTVAGNYLYFLVEEPMEVAMSATVVLKLARVALSDLQTKSAGELTINTFDLSAIGAQVSVHTLAVRELSDSLQFFVSNGSSGRLFQFGMPLAQQLDANGNLNLTLKSNPVTVCNQPSDFKVSPEANHSKLVVACESGKLLVFDAETLAPLGPPSGLAVGRAPVKIHFDTNTTTFPFRFYTANFSDGSLGVFDLNDGSNPNQAILTLKGLIFQPSALNRRGGTK